MTEVSAEELRRHVERMHGCIARFREVVPVHEEFEGQTAWEGTVHVFDVKDHPDASTAYAWSSLIKDSDRRRFYAVLAVPPIGSAYAAVRASIVQDSRREE